MKLQALVLAVMLLLTGGVAQAEELLLRNNHPSHYTVRKGDTLWDISARFLKSPWLWPRLWQANPQVANPHLIYPGDRLMLIWVNGEPRLVREGASASGEIRLSPRVRALPAVAAIPLAAMVNFTGSQRLVAAPVLEGAASLLPDPQGHPLLALNHEAYARGALQPGELYGVYHDLGPLTDEDTGREFGHRLVLAGTVIAGEPVQTGVSAVRITGLRRELRSGDRLLPLSAQSALAVYYRPAPGPALNGGRVLAMGHEGSLAGRRDVILLDRGQAQGLSSGNLYGVYRDSPAESAGELTLPALQVARVMVFQVYEQASAALVLDGDMPVRIGDRLGHADDDGGRF